MLDAQNHHPIPVSVTMSAHDVSSPPLLQANDARRSAVEEVERLLQHPEDLKRLPALREEYSQKQQARGQGPAQAVCRCVISVRCGVVQRVTACGPEIVVQLSTEAMDEGKPAIVRLAYQTRGLTPRHMPPLAAEVVIFGLHAPEQANRAQLSATVSSQTENIRTGLELVAKSKQILLKLQQSFKVPWPAVARAACVSAFAGDVMASLKTL